MIITFQAIKKKISDNPNLQMPLMFDKLFRGDENYFVASSNWYEDEFFPWYELQLRHYRVRNYKQSWDCDKYANAFQVFANICHSQTSPRKSEGLAVAEIHYLPDNSNTMHAINAVIVDSCILRFIEPQHPAFITLSTQEQRNISFIKF